MFNRVEYSILKAQKADLEEMARLLAVLFGQESEFCGNLELQKAGLSQILDEAELGQLFAAKHQEKVVGMVSLLYSVSTALGGKVAILEDMVVDPPYRGKGIGNQLIEFALQHARSVGCLRVTLLTDGDNNIAHDFYGKHGFKKSEMVVFRQVF